MAFFSGYINGSIDGFNAARSHGGHHIELGAIKDKANNEQPPSLELSSATPR